MNEDFEWPQEGDWGLVFCIRWERGSKTLVLSGLGFNVIVFCEAGRVLGLSPF